jgi:hypothetical protein
VNIRIAQILEGGIDLETMQELPRSMLLVFGDNRATMPISDDQLRVVMKLIGAAMDDVVHPNRSGMVAESLSDGNGANSHGSMSADSDYSDSETGVDSF